ncbi:MAG: glycosyltransferase family 4 protein, partial [Chloroflexi bacterium]|nr:glycosyltransferase family 4 protein [Chloroflexota bacterium]
TAAVRQGAGIGRYTRGLVRAITRLDMGNRYLLLSASGGLRAERWAELRRETWPANVRWRHLPLTDRHLAILWQRLRLPIAIEWITGPLDLFHSPDFSLPPVCRAKTVLTVHDLSFMRCPGCFPAPLLAYLMRAVPRSVRRANMVLADSQSTRDDLMELLLVPQERVAVLYPGVEPHFSAQKSAQDDLILARYGIRWPYILGLGTLQPRKNFVRLIEAFGRLRQERPVPHRLVIGGERGWLYQEIDETIARLKLNNRVHLIGFVADEDLPALYRGAAVLAFPSLYEGFGLPVLEAMACGTPVVTSTTSSLPEVAGEAALLVPPKDVEALADALWRLLDDGALRNDLRAKGFEQAKRFTWERAAKALLGIYHHVIREGG